MNALTAIKYRISKNLSPWLRNVISVQERASVLNAYKLCFIFGHMRSGSSLLNHLLTTNKEIAGFGESHLIYDWPGSFSQLIQRNLPYITEETVWVSDKILHSHMHTTHMGMLRNFIDRIIIIYRDSASSLASMVKNDIQFGYQAADYDHYVSYYISRLGELTQLAALFGPERTLFINYDELVKESETTLSKLSKFLSLRVSLTDTYSLNDKSGKYGFGDPSSKILSGRIIKENSYDQKSEHDNPYAKIAYDNFQLFRNTYQESTTLLACHRDIDNF